LAATKLRRTRCVFAFEPTRRAFHCFDKASVATGLGTLFEPSG
jgi:hypothetical protein